MDWTATCVLIRFVLFCFFYQCFGCSVGEKVFQGEDLVLVVHQGEKEMYTESGNLVFVAPGV